MAESVVKMIASVVSWLAARGVDHIIGKYLAMATIAFEKAASERALNEFRHSFDNIAIGLAAKNKDWQEWRERAQRG